MFVLLLHCHCAAGYCMAVWRWTLQLLQAIDAFHASYLSQYHGLDYYFSARALWSNAIKKDKTVKIAHIAEFLNLNCCGKLQVTTQLYVPSGVGESPIFATAAVGTPFINKSKGMKGWFGLSKLEWISCQQILRTNHFESGSRIRHCCQLSLYALPNTYFRV